MAGFQYIRLEIVPAFQEPLFYCLAGIPGQQKRNLTVAELQDNRAIVVLGLICWGRWLSAWLIQI